jgi:hypothetical protein
VGEEEEEDATHRFAFECLNKCFPASLGASSVEIRSGSWPREAIFLSLKRRLSDFPRQFPSLSDAFGFIALCVACEGIAEPVMAMMEWRGTRKASPAPVQASTANRVTVPTLDSQPSRQV